MKDLKSLKFYGGQLQDTKENTRTFPDKHADYGDIELSEPIVNALLERGIEQLYIHQTEALAGLFDGHHVIVSTSTASGKSLIYQIPVLESLLRDKTSKAMYIFPTKALAQDQKRALEELIHQIPPVGRDHGTLKKLYLIVSRMLMMHSIRFPRLTEIRHLINVHL